MATKVSKPWFRPKRYGYGAGLPIAWQGWVVLAVYFLIVLGATAVFPVFFSDPALFVPVAMFVDIPATAILLIICAAKTEGGWRWRWGKDS